VDLNYFCVGIGGIRWQADQDEKKELWPDVYSVEYRSEEVCTAGDRSE